MNVGRNPLAPDSPSRFRDGEFSDDEEGDRVVYNHNYFESLQGLYKLRKEDTNQTLQSADCAEHNDECIIASSCVKSPQWEQKGISNDMQLSIQERKARESLEKLHAFSFGGNQGICSKIKLPFENHFPCTTAEGNKSADPFSVNHVPFKEENKSTDLISSEDRLCKNERQHAGLCSISERIHVGKRQRTELEDYSKPKSSGTWSKIIKEVEKLQQKHDDQRNVNLRNGKKKLKFSIRQPKSQFGNGALIPSTQCNLNMSMAQRLDALLKDNTTASDVGEPSKLMKDKEVQKSDAARPLTKGKMNFFTSLSYDPKENNCLPSFSSKETDASGSNIVCPLNNKRTLNDRFQEALNAIQDCDSNGFISGCKGPAFGFANRLQRIIQQEKQQRMQFMKELPSAKLHGYANCLFVRITGKCFEAKLTICKCTIESVPENIQQDQDAQHYKASSSIKVIFNPRINGDLDLEIGKLIRLHPPWKQIKLANDEMIVLGTCICEMVCDL